MVSGNIWVRRVLEISARYGERGNDLASHS